MTVEVVNLDKMMLSKTSEYQEGYVPHRINLNDLSIGSNQINDLTSGVKSILGAYSNNIIDLSKVLSETYVEFSTGKILPSANFNVCGFYEVRPLTQYQTSSNYFQQFVFMMLNINTFQGWQRLTHRHLHSQRQPMPNTSV